jgi:hypothetical protein
MTVHAAATIATAQTRQEIGQAVSLKALKLAQSSQENVLGLLESAAALAQQIQASEPGKGEQVDLTA